jgi:hypothetical protein
MIENGWGTRNYFLPNMKAALRMTLTLIAL